MGYVTRTEDTPADVDPVLWHLHKAVMAAQKEQSRAPMRELAVVITHMETAVLWRKEQLEHRYD